MAILKPECYNQKYIIMDKENYDIWFENIKIDQYPKTSLPSETEVLIIGGGIAGITSAYLLAKAGKKVVLLEKKKIGNYVTSATTGFLTTTIDTEPQILIGRFGKKNATLILESQKDAINNIEQIIKSENIECEFSRCTNYIYANDSKEEEKLKKIAEAYSSLGILANYKKDDKLKLNTLGYIEMPGHAKFHVIKYIMGLAKAATKYGAIIAEDTEVLSVKDKNNYVDVEIAGAIIKTKNVVSAVYKPFKNPKYLAKLSKIYVEYVIEYQLQKDKYIEGTYEDTRLPYNYFRIDKKDSYDRLLIGGADSLVSLKIDKEINRQVMQKYSKLLFGTNLLKEVRHWTGTMVETADGLAYIGNSLQKNIFYIFGFSGNGMTYSYIAGKILLDKLLQKDNPYSKIYHVDRQFSWFKIIFLKLFTNY